ncbi:conserved hypothetical protein [Histoplasma capsulatum H143]|uniref:Uncharacterized protein n=1 Tax=Ajellomyces capsulatus (strain H143) TaxID=544712 RepID=C6HG68_AJECH|nr:conserved hypothetical protein [Histoplasma capsulatum H143]
MQKFSASVNFTISTSNLPRIIILSITMPWPIISARLAKKQLELEVRDGYLLHTTMKQKNVSEN